MPVAAPIAGGLAAGAAGSLLSKGGGGTTTTVQNQAPWSGVQPYLSNLFSSAGNYAYGPFNAQQYLAANPDVAAAGVNPYQHWLQFGMGEGRQGGGSSTPQSYLADQSPYTIQSQNMAVNMANDPNSVIGQSQSLLGNTIAGKYLTPDSNPYLQASVQDALGLAGSAFAKQYGGAAGQNLGNSGYQEALARGLGATATNAYSNAYSQERQNQLNAMQLAPSLGTANIQLLSSVGAQQEARKQAELDAPYQTLQRYQALISGQPGGSTSLQSPYFTDPLSQALGYGLGGMGIYSMGQKAGLFGGGSSPTPMLSPYDLGDVYSAR